jgi:FMN phosphatase YigB (HAD superfamily)
MMLELALLFFRTFSYRRTITVMRSIVCFRRVREELRSLGQPEESLDNLQYREPANRLGEEEAIVREVVQEWIYERPLSYLRCARRCGLDRFFATLDAQEIRVGVFSDYPVQEKLEALGYLHRFSLWLCATDPDINAFKPHPAGFLRACEIWGLQPAEVLYIGNRPEVDAAGARAAGMSCAILGGAPAGDGYESFRSFEDLCHAITYSR